MVYLASIFVELQYFYLVGLLMCYIDYITQPDGLLAKAYRANRVSNAIRGDR